MGFARPAIVTVLLGPLVVFSVVSAGSAEQQEPTPRQGQGQQAAPAPMWPGMMRGPMMGAMPMGDMNQMMQVCAQMMSGTETAPPAQPGPGGR